MQHRYFILVSVGVVLSVLLYWANSTIGGFAMNQNGQGVARWYALTSGLLQTLAGVLPAFVVGFVAGRWGALLGALVGSLGALAVAVLFNVIWQSLAGIRMVDATFLALELLVLSLGPAVIGLVSGAAGAHFARRRTV